MRSRYRLESKSASDIYDKWDDLKSKVSDSDMREELFMMHLEDKLFQLGHNEQVVSKLFLDALSGMEINIPLIEVNRETRGRKGLFSDEETLELFNSIRKIIHKEGLSIPKACEQLLERGLWPPSIGVPEEWQISGFKARNKANTVEKLGNLYSNYQAKYPHIFGRRSRESRFYGEL